MKKKFDFLAYFKKIPKKQQQDIMKFLGFEQKKEAPPSDEKASSHDSSENKDKAE